MTSAELARVVETGTTRHFLVTNDDGMVAEVEYSITRDSLWCYAHTRSDNCTCTARVRLCGILTNTVVPDVRNYRRPVAANKEE